ncbi:unnamed protein product [Chrysoparadoxa australica]
MTKNTYVGYQGFRTSGQILPPSHKPGETLGSRNAKYAKTGHGVTYATKAAREGTMMKTFNQESSANVCRHDYKVPDRRGVSAFHESAPPAERSKPFLHSTLHVDSFKTYNDYIGAIVQADPELYRPAFDDLASGKGYVETRDLPQLVMKVHGASAPRWAMDKLIKALDYIRDGRVHWEDFLEGLEKIKSSLEQDIRLQKSNSVPGWLAASKMVKPTTEKAPQRSTYQADLGSFGHNPGTRPWTFKTGMSSTCQDLYAGTTKDTYHIPGYGGFIPRCKANARACEHGDSKPTATAPSTSFSCVSNCHVQALALTAHALSTQNIFSNPPVTALSLPRAGAGALSNTGTLTNAQHVDSSR